MFGRFLRWGQLGSAYNNSLTLLEKIKCIREMVNDLYDNEVELNQKLDDLVKWIEEDGFNIHIATHMEEMLNDGTLAKVINQTIFNDLNTEVNQLKMSLDNKTDKTETNGLKQRVEQLELKDDGMINVKSYGAKGDGVADDTIAIQTAITENPYKTIYFPSGRYLISQTIKTNLNNAEYQNILLDKTATVFTNTSLNALFELGGLGGTEGGGVDLRYKFFKGGVLDAGNCISAIKIHPQLMGLDISEFEVRNFLTYGIYVPKGENIHSSDLVIRDGYINGRNSVMDNQGIHLERPDNKIVNLRINAVKTAIYLEAGGQTINNVQGLYVSYTDTVPANFNESVFLHFKAGQDVILTDCYADTFSTFVYSESNSAFILTNSIFFSYLHNVDITLFRFKHDLTKYIIKNNTFNVPIPKTKHKGIVYESFNSQHFSPTMCVVEDNVINDNTLFEGDLITNVKGTYTPYWLNSTSLSTSQWLKVGYVIGSVKYLSLNICIDGFNFVMNGKIERYNNTSYLTYRSHRKDSGELHSVKVGFKYLHNDCGYPVFAVYLAQVSGETLPAHIQITDINNNPIMYVSQYTDDVVFENVTVDQETTI